MAFGSKCVIDAVTLAGLTGIKKAHLFVKCYPQRYPKSKGPHP